MNDHVRDVGEERSRDIAEDMNAVGNKFTLGHSKHDLKDPIELSLFPCEDQSEGSWRKDYEGSLPKASSTNCSAEGSSISAKDKLVNGSNCLETQSSHERQMGSKEMEGGQKQQIGDAIASAAGEDFGADGKSAGVDGLSEEERAARVLEIERGIANEQHRVTQMLRAFMLAKYVKQDADPCQVDKGLWVGSIGCAYNRDGLVAAGITHIVIVANALTALYPKDFTYLHIDVLDSPNVRVDAWFEPCFQFIDKAIAQGGGVLVHCFAGRSRSVTIVAAYLMKTKRIPLAEALAVIRRTRPGASPNAGFLQQLMMFEAELKLASQPSIGDTQPPITSL